MNPVSGDNHKTLNGGGWRLAQICAAGLAIAVVICADIYYVAFAKRGDVYDRVRIAVAQGQLNALVTEIELYKVQNGHYPASLDELQKRVSIESAVFAHDPTDLRLGAQRRLFQYERVGQDHYYLGSPGLDGLLFTEDDIVPQVDPTSSAQFGLLVRPAASLGAGGAHP